MKHFDRLELFSSFFKSIANKLDMIGQAQRIDPLLKRSVDFFLIEPPSHFDAIKYNMQQL